MGAFTGPLVAGLLGHELADLEAPVFELIVAVDDPETWLTLTEGRLPARCEDGERCEAVLLSESAPDVDFRIARPAPGVELTIVGRGLLHPAMPFGDLDQRGPFGSRPIGGGEYQTGRSSPAVILVNGVEAVAKAPAFDRTGRTYVWTAPLDVDRVHPWTAGALRDATAALARDLAADDTAFTVTSPMPGLEAALGSCRRGPRAPPDRRVARRGDPPRVRGVRGSRHPGGRRRGGRQAQGGRVPAAATGSRSSCSRR